MACLRSEGSRENVSLAPAAPAAVAPQQRSIVQIYTDWANHYLERGRYKRYIQDLQSDVCDGVLLADVIDAVAGGARVPDINRKPKSNSQMLDNINACLTYLGALGVCVEGVTAKDIREGNLKTILGLFFTLSRYKQAQKAAAAASSRSPQVTTPPGPTPYGCPGPGMPCHRMPDLMATSVPNSHSKLPSLHSSKPRTKDVFSAIPAPCGTLQRRTSGSGDNKTSSSSKTPSSSPSPVSNNVINANGAVDSLGNRVSASASFGVSGLAAPKSSANSSRSGSPHTGSFIPQPKATVITRDRNTSDRSRPSSTASASSISHLPVKSAVGVPVRQQQPASAANGHAGHKAAGANNAANVSLNNNSMLDKFKFFNSKDKGAHDKSKGTASRRPSSSSGLSSARSEKSDSSVSLCGDPPGSPSPGTSPAPAAADAFQAKFHSTAAPASHCNGGVPNSALVAEGTEASVNSPAAGVKSLSKKNFGRSIGKHPAATTTKTTPVANAAPNSSDVVRSGLPRSSPSTDTLSRNASKSTNGGGSRPTSTGHELSGQVAVGKSSSFQDSNIHSSATDDKQSDMNNGTPNPGSGIPKPTAAVKGTSKHSREDLSVLSTLPPEKPEKPDKAREDANPMTTIATSESMASLKSPGSKEHVHAQQDQVTSQSTGKPETQHKNDRSKKNSQQNVSIAMVSPIMSTQHSLSKDSITSSTESSTATSIISKEEPQDNKDTKGSLVGGMESTIKSVSAETKPVPKSNASEAKDGDEVEDALANIQPMQPLNRASPYGGYARSLSGHRAARLPACLRLQADVHRVARHMMAASQDIARLYGAQRVGTASDYAELTAGYVSDGDVLRAPTAEEVASGYMSEGGASLYARRPVRCPVKDPKLVNVLQDDRNTNTVLEGAKRHRLSFLTPHLKFLDLHIRQQNGGARKTVGEWSVLTLERIAYVVALALPCTHQNKSHGVLIIREGLVHHLTTFLLLHPLQI